MNLLETLKNPILQYLKYVFQKSRYSFRRQIHFGYLSTDLTLRLAQ